MRKGRPLAPLCISGEDRTQLDAWSKRPKTAQALALRSRIVLPAGDGLSNTAITKQLHTMQHTVGKWRRRYSKSGLDDLLDEPRPGASRKPGDADVERVLTLTLESTPEDATHWPTRSMAKRVGLSRTLLYKNFRERTPGAGLTSPVGSVRYVPGLKCQTCARPVPPFEGVPPSPVCQPSIFDNKGFTGLGIPVHI